MRQFDFDAVSPGEALGPISYVLTQQKLDSFRAAVNDPDAVLTTIASKDYSYLLATKYERSSKINARHEAWYSRAPVVGEEISVSGELADKYVKRDRRYVVVRTRSVGASGDEIARTETTLLIPDPKPTEQE